MDHQRWYFPNDRHTVLNKAVEGSRTRDIVKKIDNWINGALTIQFGHLDPAVPEGYSVK